MDKKQFKDFCKKEFYKRGYTKHKNTYYLLGKSGILSSIELQKSNYGAEYYINYNFFIGDFDNVPINSYPKSSESDIYERIEVMSVKQQINGEAFMTGQIEYEEYTEETLRPYFDDAFDTKILPPLSCGKEYILNNLGKLYELTLRKNEVLEKLQAHNRKDREKT